MRNNLAFLFIASLLLWGCSGDDSDDSKQESGNVKMNKWVYAMMKHHYLWTDDMPAEGEVNFSQNLSNFYQSIKSPKDRFSYFEANITYNGSLDMKAFFPDKNNSVLSVTDSRRVLEANGIMGASRNADSIYIVGNHIVGYLLYYSFGAKEELLPVLKKFNERGVTDIVLDWRFNGGGYVDTAIFLSSCIIPMEYRGMDAQYQVYNPTVTLERFGSPDGHDTYKFMGNGSLRGCGLDVGHAYFLVGGQTASASESTIKMVEACLPVTTIGTRTTGKGVGMYDIKDNNYPYYLVPITFRYYNSKWETVPDEGLVPDYVFETAMPNRVQDLGDTSEPLLAKALDLIGRE